MPLVFSPDLSPSLQSKCVWAHLSFRQAILAVASVATQESDIISETPRNNLESQNVRQAIAFLK